MVEGRRLAASLGRRALVACIWFALFSWPLAAAEAVTVDARAETGFARLVFDFHDRLDLPSHKVLLENNVLVVDFDEETTMVLPPVETVLRDYFSVGRLDPRGRGARFGLRKPVRINTLVAGEKLFVDILPRDWQGHAPGLPPDVVATLAARGKAAAVSAARAAKIEAARTLKPTATLRVGRNPTFLRTQFDWSVDTKASFIQDGTAARIEFDWPVPIDLYPLNTDTPAEVTNVANVVGETSTSVNFTLAEGIVPRFYVDGARRFVLDIDLGQQHIDDTLAQAAAAARHDAQIAAEAGARGRAVGEVAHADVQDETPAAKSVATVVPELREASGTVRVVFPFVDETAAAAFHRGGTLWLIFDTPAAIAPLPTNSRLDAVADGLSVIGAGDSQIVRIDLATKGLVTLASEGTNWVVSIGDVLLGPTLPVSFKRLRDDTGRFEMTVDMGRPNRAVQFRDPVVGDLLEVVTGFGPARGTTRDLRYVDFEALQSIHGLVLRPENEDIEVRVDADMAVIGAPEGLLLSDRDAPREFQSGVPLEQRDSYIDIASLNEVDARNFSAHVEELTATAAQSEGRARETARLDLAQYYVANRYALEALGVLEVLEGELKTEDLRKRVKLTGAVANAMAGRTREAIEALSMPAFADSVDALMWRAIAKADAHDFAGARSDALLAEGVIDAYPNWVQAAFLFAATRAALEVEDAALAQRYLDTIAFTQLDPEDASLYQLLRGRIAELDGKFDEALDIYGEVIDAEFRPTRAEAVYRTLKILKAQGTIDREKAAQTLSAEALLWRGTPLETQMQRLLAELYFEHKDFRLGFEVARDAAAYGGDSRQAEMVVDQATRQFADLFLNGAADQLPDLEALALFYDFRQLTPAGARGDEMIRNLARRLVKVDLLDQAEGLLGYQVDSRLQGVARAHVAADLALVQVANRKPEEALRTLNRTRVASLSPMLERQRRVLEARALIDVGRADLALDLLARLGGRDVDLLRIDGYWTARNYLAAAELIEGIYTNSNDQPLTEAGRRDLIRAAVGLVQVDDRIGLSRLRDKFAARMSQEVEWPLFDYLTSPEVSVVGLPFKQAARLISATDSVTSFLGAYRETYPSSATMTPTGAAAANAV